MHCSTAFLTCLISQALLQAVLDKESSELHGWLLLREFLSLPVSSEKHSNTLCNANASQSCRWQPPPEHPSKQTLAQLQPCWLGSRLPSVAIRSSVSASSHGSSSNGKSAWHNYLVETGSPPFPIQDQQNKGTEAPCCHWNKILWQGSGFPMTKRTGGIGLTSGNHSDPAIRIDRLIDRLIMEDELTFLASVHRY
jgi:hypothetical protein